MKKTSRLSELGEKVVRIERQIRHLEEENAGVFEKWKELQDTKEGVIEQMKIVAREASTEGETKVLIESRDLMVSVVGRKRPIIYDYEMAKKYLDISTIEILRPDAIDPKKVAAFKSRLSQRDLDRITTFGELPTPAVTIKLS